MSLSPKFALWLLTKCMGWFMLFSEVFYCPSVLSSLQRMSHYIQV